MVLVHINTQIKIFIKVVGNQIKNKDMEYFSIIMEINMLEIGLMIWSKGKES